MPRCDDVWVRKGAVTVTMTVTRPSNPPFYSLKVIKEPTDSRQLPVDHETFDSNQLAAGASWQVPANYRCKFSLVSAGNQVLGTAIQIDGQPVQCSAGSHCQGACTPAGTAGVAGFWTLTTWN